MNKRNTLTKKISILGILGNIFLFIIKIIFGILSNSLSMIADSFNSLSDIFASFMTYIGNKISSVPNDNDHNFGHGKAEYIFSMLISISMIIVSLKLLYDAVCSIITNNKLVFSWNLIIVCIITITVKLILFICTKRVYLKNNNLLLKANMIDHRNDMIITSFTCISIILTKCNVYFVDGIVGIGISIWIFYTGLKIFKESYDVLMDSSIDEKSKNSIKKIIEKYHDIKRIGNLYSIPIGYKYIIVITIFVDGNMQTKDSHDIATLIEKEIKDNIDIIDQVLVHVEPFD